MGFMTLCNYFWSLTVYEPGDNMRNRAPSKKDVLYKAVSLKILTTFLVFAHQTDCLTCAQNGIYLFQPVKSSTIPTYAGNFRNSLTFCASRPGDHWRSLLALFPTSSSSESQDDFFIKLLLTFYEVSTSAKIRNRYNQVPHLTQDTT